MSKVIDVLLLQLGTPAAPTARALRPYLKEFLSDKRVIEAPWACRWMLVYGYVLPFRARSSAQKYARIWSAQEGSPLMSITQRQTSALQSALGDDFRVSFAMRYGEPSTRAVIRQLFDKKRPGGPCERLIVLPMYPQYSATTTASALDGLFEALKQERVLPAMRTIATYHDDPNYLDAVVQGIERELAKVRGTDLEPQKYIISFHGIPIRYIKRGDPYMRYAAITGKAVARQFGWSKSEWQLCFQSRFGPTKWLTPYTDETLVRLGKEGVRNVLVAQPGFTADCLETIDEIGNEGREEFQHAGGQHLLRVPCLNDDPPFIRALKHLVEREAEGWQTPTRQQQHRQAEIKAAQTQELPTATTTPVTTLATAGSATLPQTQIQTQPQPTNSHS